MIELRCVERVVRSSVTGTGGYNVSIERVLQYRALSFTQDASGALSLCGSRWMPWQDVPTVREE